MSGIDGMIDPRHFEEDGKNHLRDKMFDEALKKEANKTLGFMGERDPWKDVLKTPKEEKKNHGLRYNDGKLKWSYVRFKNIEAMVRVLMYGAQKYAPFNWMKGLDKTEVLESAMRHITAMLDGEVNDPESGLPHEGHVMCNMMFYSYMIERDKVNQKS